MEKINSDRSCEKLRNMTKSYGGENILHLVNRRKSNRIGHTLPCNGLLKRVTGGKIGERL